MGAAGLVAIIAPLLIGAVGLFIAVMGAARLTLDRAFARRAVRAEGTIVGFGPRRLPRRIVEYPRARYVDYPIIDYVTGAGQPARFEAPNGTSRHLTPEGTRVPILYDPADPADGRLALGGNSAILPIALIVVGAVLACSAVVVAVVLRFVIA